MGSRKPKPWRTIKRFRVHLLSQICSKVKYDNIHLWLKAFGLILFSRERYVVQELCKVGSEADIQSFEYIRGVLLEPILFSVDNGLLTGNTF